MAENPTITYSIEELFNQFEARLNARFDVIDKRFDAIDKRFDKLESKIERIDERVGKLEVSVARLDEKTDWLGKVSITVLTSIVIAVLGLFAKLFNFFGVNP